MMALLPLLAIEVPPAPLKTQNVVFVMVDGLRWQEVFRGAERALVDGVKEKATRDRFWSDRPQERREKLMPFLWSKVASEGQVLGNRDLGSECRVTNPYRFSYPGYSETLCGYVDLGINSNAYRPNPNVTVFEWLSKQPKWRGEVAAFGAWDVIGAVFNKARAGFVVNAGYEPLTEGKLTPGIEVLNHVKAEQSRKWEGEPYDVVTFRTALDYVRANRPRLTYISLGEPDEWAHAGDYGAYLTSTRRWDDYVRELWTTLQAIPQYRDKTTLVLTCDHGRGEGPQWTDHGADVKGAEATWMAFLGPDTPASSESKSAKATNSQIAATIARTLGFDYNAWQPKAGVPVEGVLVPVARRAR